MINNIIFDFNGTLIDDGYLCYKIEDETMNFPNKEEFTFEKYRDIFCHPISEYYKLLGMDEKKYDYKKMNDTFFNEYQNRYKSEAKLFDGVKETLTYFKNKGYKLFILSATEINLLKEQLTYLDILKYFDDFIASSKKDSAGKKDYGKEFVIKHNLNKENAILIGDTTHDFEVGEYLDVNILLFDKGHNSRKQLQKLGAPIVSSYYEIRDYIEDLNR